MTTSRITNLSPSVLKKKIHRDVCVRRCNVETGIPVADASIYHHCVVDACHCTTTFFNVFLNAQLFDLRGHCTGRPPIHYTGETPLVVCCTALETFNGGRVCCQAHATLNVYQYHSFIRDSSLEEVCTPIHPKNDIEKHTTKVISDGQPLGLGIQTFLSQSFLRVSWNAPSSCSKGRFFG